MKIVGKYSGERFVLLALIKSSLLAGTVKSYSCSSIQFRHWPFAGPLNAPPLCCGCTSVTLSKHFGHLWGMKRAITGSNYFDVLSSFALQRNASLRALVTKILPGRCKSSGWSFSHLVTTFCICHIVVFFGIHNLASGLNWPFFL